MFFYSIPFKTKNVVLILERDVAMKKIIYFLITILITIYRVKPTQPAEPIFSTSIRMTEDLLYWCDGVVVRASASQSVDLGFIS